MITAVKRYQGRECHITAVKRYRGRKCSITAVKRYQGRECHITAVKRYQGRKCSITAVKRYPGRKCSITAVKRYPGRKCSITAVKRYPGRKCSITAVKRYQGRKCYITAVPSPSSSPSLVLTAEVKYSSRKIALKTAPDGEKNMTHASVSILEQIIATVLFLCISSINNKRSLLRFQSTTPPTYRGWSACEQNICFVSYFGDENVYRRFEKHNYVLSFIHCHGICVYIVLSLLIARLIRLAIILPAERKGIKQEFSYK